MCIFIFRIFYRKTARVCLSRCSLAKCICNQKANCTNIRRIATMLEIKLLKADEKWWSAGEHRIRVYNSIVWFLRRKTKALHVFAKRAASIRMRPALLPTRFDDTLLLARSTVIPSVLLCAFRTRVCVPAETRTTIRRQPLAVYPQSIKATCQHEYQKRGR